MAYVLTIYSGALYSTTWPSKVVVTLFASQSLGCTAATMYELERSIFETDQYIVSQVLVNDFGIGEDTSSM